MPLSTRMFLGMQILSLVLFIPNLVVSSPSRGDCDSDAHCFTNEICDGYMSLCVPRHTEAMPQDECSVGGGPGEGDDYDIYDELITEKVSHQAKERARCVPFNQCCEEPSFLGLIDERTGNTIINITDGGNQKCGGLDLCCRHICETGKPTTTPTTTEAPTGKFSCGKRNTDGFKIKVTGFNEGQTQQGEFPWMVAVLERDTTYVGGGSLVRPTMVLTAGHKVHLKNADNLVARLGDWDIAEQIESIAPQNIDVEQILFHPQFRRKKPVQYNVAILILKTEAQYGPTVAPVCLPEPGQNFDGKNCFVTGWGSKDLEDIAQHQKIMKKVSVPVVEHSRCQSLLREAGLPSRFVLHSSSICAGGRGGDACRGDGGSPLVCPGVTNPDELVQVGVVSWGIGCGIEGNPGVYGSVIESIEWIDQNIVEEVVFDERIIGK